MTRMAPSVPRTWRGHPLVNRDYAWLFIGQAISLVGDFLFDTNLVLWVADQFARNQLWAPLAVSGVLLAVSLPTFVLGPIAGVFADRWDKRRTLLWADATRALLIGALALLCGAMPLPFVPGGRLSNSTMLGVVYGVVFLATVCAQFFNPARLAIVGDLVTEPDRARTSGMAQMTANLAMIIGPPLAAALFFGLGAQWALLVNALSFGASFLCVLPVRAPRLGRAPRPESRRRLASSKSWGQAWAFWHAAACHARCWWRWCWCSWAAAPLRRWAISS